MQNFNKFHFRMNDIDTDSFLCNTLISLYFLKALMMQKKN